MKFLIAEDHPIVFLGTKSIIQRKFPEAEVFEARNQKSILKLIQNNVFDVVLLDIQLDEIVTIGFIKQLLILRPGLRIIILSQQPEEVFGRHYIVAGAMAYLSKKCDVSVFEAALEMVLTNRVFLTEQLRFEMLQIAMQKDSVPLKLSDRELDVLTHVMNGYTTQEIASRLNLQSTTVSTYKTRLFEKFRTNNPKEIGQLIEALQIV